ncbi:MFS transporter [Micromonospora auratinigra]|uniref:Major Facilitator Superfamily protein n=1 Tax=Micromonospora auratinigra TaxID=261654 RepID=A0A1A8Z935_9ACTN|nr:MFS transporter [Micromonospora auratinigra]SBT40372.1 Major Facilitator Superfamily protein [Micromonospora auratinigra]
MRRNAVLFVAISLLSGFGSTTMALAVSIWLLDLTGSSSRAALAGLCVYAPTLAGPWLGGILDRLPRRPVVVAVNLGLAAALLCLLAVRTAADAWLLFAVSLCYGLSYVLIDAGESALLPRALGAGRLADVNGWRSSAQEGAKLVAPLVGAGLYAWRGGHLVALVSAALPVLVALLYLTVRLTDPPPAPSAPVSDGAPDIAPGDAAATVGAAPDGVPGTACTALPTGRDRGLRAGLRVLRRDPVLRRSVGLAAVVIALSGFTTAPLFQVVTVDLRLPSTFLGVLASAQGAGSLVAGVVVGRLITRHGPVPVAVGGAVLFAVSCLLRCAPWWPVTVAAGVLAGIGLPVALVAAVTTVQTRTPEPLLGRVAATANTAMFGPVAAAIPLGSVAVHLGGRPPFVVAAVVSLVAAAVAVRRRGCPLPGAEPVLTASGVRRPVRR